MAFALDRLDHLVLTVAHIDAAVVFYTEVLGMEAVVTNGRTSLTYGVEAIHLHQRGHEFKPHAAHPTPGAGDLCFVTMTPLEEVMAYLAAMRVHIEEGPVDREGAMGRIRSVYVRDPDRNLVEIANYL